MKEQKIRVCEICNKPRAKFQKKLCGSQDCFKLYYKKKELVPDDIVTCLVCHKIMKDKLSSHLIVHQLNKKSYMELFPEAICESPNYLKFLSEKMKGSKNIAYNHGGKFSPFSSKFIKYQDLSDKEKQLKKDEKQNQRISTTKTNNNFTTTIQYYLKKGMTYEEAQKSLTARQKTFSLDNCIEKYGEEKGKKIWNARQTKWLHTLDKKSDEEKMRINRLKTASGGSISMAEKEIKKFFDDNKLAVYTQYTINSKVGYTYDFCFGDKILEYNGTYWHCDPRKYKSDYMHHRIGKTAKEIWESDEVKQQHAILNGYKILVIWEDDYKKNKQEILNQCINFMRS
jgi:hypothetical protein